MATTTFSAAPISDTDANFRIWGLATSTALATVGFIKTTDTGQVDWATVTRPTAVNQIKGYEIWRFNDSLQATYPLYFKLEYGAGVFGSGENPGMWLTIGKGSSGAGVITGTILAQTQIASGWSNATPYTWYMSSGEGSMLCFAPAAAWWDGSSSQKLMSFVIERQRTSNGAAVGTGLIQVNQSYHAITPAVRVYNYSGAGLADTKWPVALPGVATTLTGGGNIPLFPASVSDGAGLFWQPRSILIGYKADIGALASISVAGWNTYLPITGMTQFDANVNTNARAAIAWW